MKILAVSDSVTINTGFSRVMRSMLPALVEAGHDVTMVGWGYDGGEHEFPFKIIPCNTYEDRYGEDIVATYIRTYRPDILFTLGEPWALEWVEILEERKSLCHIGYFPIDGGPIPPEWHSWIKSIDVPIVMSKYGVAEVKKSTGIEPLFLPHGVHTETFKPMADQKKEFRKNIMGLDEDAFVVGCVARNQPRKNLPALIKSFADFSIGKDNTYLYLHTQVRDVGWNLDEVAERYGVTNKVITTADFKALHGISDEHLAKIYNMFDVMALPTMAEGFGLPILESQSCGVPVLVSDCSACTELVADRSELINIKARLTMGRGIDQAIPDTDDLTRKLKVFYRNWKFNDSSILKKLGEDGRKIALDMDWDGVNKKFLQLLINIEPDVKKIEKRIKPVFYSL